MANTHDTLRVLVTELSCRPGWEFSIQPAGDEHQVMVELVISIPVIDSRTYPQPGLRRVNNHFAVPEVTYNRETWRRWVFTCCQKVDSHELMEWFKDRDERPYAPLHGPGNDPYEVHDFRPEIETRINQWGEVEEKP